MIKSLNIENFRSYENVNIKFHPGINIFIGQGCNGKTNIVRTVKLLRYFRPINFIKFHSHFSNKEYTKISANLIDFDKETTVDLLRHKTASKCVYSITQNANTETFRRFNKTVPKEIVDALNLHDINFQYQLDSPFVISESPGKITKIINSITKIDDVDKWIKKLNSIIRDTDKDLKEKRIELKDIKKQLSQLKDLNVIGKQIKELNKTERDISKLEIEYDNIEQLLKDINDHENKIKRLNNKLKIEKDYDKLQKINDQIEECYDTIDIINEIIGIKKNIDNLKIEHKEKIKTYIKELKKENKCPFCFHKINDKCIKRIKDSLI